MYTGKKQLRTDEGGFASLVVAMIMILVLSLITIGFAQLARREQKNSLDKQLAQQAYYAAETGINDAYNLVLTKGGLYDQVKAGGIISSTDCLNQNSAIWRKYVDGLPSTAIDSNIDTNMGTSYSCVMVNMHPRSLNYSGVSPGAYRDVVFSAVNADNGSDSNLKKLIVNWGSHDSHTGLETTDGFKPTAGTNPNWGANSLGVIQFSVTPLNDSFTRDQLMNNTFTVYMYPKSGAGTVNWPASIPDGDGAVVNGNCTGSGDNQCQVTIDNIPLAPNYLIHFIDYYDSSNVTITGKDASSNLIGFEGGQIVIDSTGRARDVLKRLQVHVPLTVDGTKPTEAVEGQSVCKRFTTDPRNNPQHLNPSGYSGKACDYWSQ